MPVKKIWNIRRKDKQGFRGDMKEHGLARIKHGLHGLSGRGFKYLIYCEEIYINFD